MQSTNAPKFRQEIIINDVHSQLNPTSVKDKISPNSVTELRHSLIRASRQKEKISIAGGRYAMGGQQFAKNQIHIDMSRLNKPIYFDKQNGLIEIEAGIMWPQLIEYLQKSQINDSKKWTIWQKQTGCNQVSLAGAISANAHGRGLKLAPIIEQVASFKLMNEKGELITCSRNENSELFSLVIGGYGLFGSIYSITLKLTEQTLLQRKVSLAKSDEIIQLLENESNNGALYGDFQFSIDNNNTNFLRHGILSTYHPIKSNSFQQEINDKKLLDTADWEELLYLAHTDKDKAFEKYSSHYLKTNGQIYASDSFQLATYINNYHEIIDKRLNSTCKSSEIITELYVPRQYLDNFLIDAADLLRERNADVIYGTVRLIEKDSESFLSWAKQNWACIVLNLHVNHNDIDIKHNKETFRDLIDLAIKYGGCYYLTYHRFAKVDQLLTCYPEITQFMSKKIEYDPNEFFYSDWYTHIKELINTK